MSGDAKGPAGRVGQQFGKYRLVRLLGSGGFAEVYLGEHLRLGSQAAIKVLHARLADADAEQFLQEARTIANLTHPHIVRVWDCDLEQGTPFIVMEYAPGGTLRQVHPKGQGPSLAQIVAYTNQVASALQYAHEQRLIHRDIKPQNMLVARDGGIWLSDFGIATVAHSSLSQHTQNIAGTLAYMAPEQIQGHPRPASDQYSLAIVVYEWISGVRPFQGTSAELTAQHIHTPPPPLRNRVPGLLAAVEEVVMIALSKDYKARFINVAAFARALEEECRPYLSERAVYVPEQTSLPERTTDKPGQQSPKIAAEAAGIVAKKDAANGTDPSAKKSAPVRIDRRAATAAVVGCVLVGGTGAYLALLHGLQTSSPSGSTKGVVSPTATAAIQEKRPTPTPTPAPVPGTLLTTFTGHTDVINWVSWSPDNKRVVSASADKTAQIWNASDGGDVLRYTLHTDVVFVAAWSPSGAMIASGSIDSLVRVWNPANGQDIYVYSGHKGVVGHLAWSPDSTRIASSGEDQTVQVWNARDGGNHVTYRRHQSGVLGVAWSPDGKYIASGDENNEVHIWKASDASHVFTYTGHTKFVFSVPWQPLKSAKRVASAGGDTTVQVWNAFDGSQPIVYRGHSDWVYALSWSPDGKRIASASQDRTVHLWDPTDASYFYVYRGHNRSVNAVAWSPDNHAIASGSVDTTVQIWDSGS